MKKVIVVLIVLIGFSGYAQSDLNQYKYVIVPKKFDAFRNVNEHQTSTLIKYLFNGKGFNTVYDDALPNDLSSNRCLGIMAYLQDDSNLFTTKTTILLKDCNGVEVYRTMEGSSKIKEFKAAYNEAIKEAMRTFNGVNYAYSGKSDSKAPITVSFKNDVKKLDEEEAKHTVVTSKTEEVQLVPNPVVTQVATETTQYYKDVTPVESEIKGNPQGELPVKKMEIKNLEVKDMWYAQSTENGYQLVDSTPKIRMRLLKSSADNVFMAQTDAKNGMVYQKDGNWIFEYYENDQLVQEKLNIKF